MALSLSPTPYCPRFTRQEEEEQTQQSLRTTSTVQPWWSSCRDRYTRFFFSLGFRFDEPRSSKAGAYRALRSSNGRSVWHPLLAPSKWKDEEEIFLCF
ncbi:hypothetical protein JTE90_006575 [Oedothorax gibbosus]|uniref:Uncharacterized protein n=1 Tax=Oedothorax gibbosus TaxID=931172 RepID=A0AAV6VIN1_9ARAC|nr:hypothetical protein JTE90_006575 [Oedothorax gibbosus]